jgi:ribosomal-protein-serine acetyltransferase
MEEQPNLVSGQVLLRPYRPDDADDLYAAARESIAEVYPWMPWCHPDYSIDESIAYARQCSARWREGTEYGFVITDAGGGSFLGGCGMEYINPVNRIVSLGYWVRTSRTRQGVASTATRLLTRFGFEELKLNRIEIIASIDNQASQRVAEKTGAIREGVLRNRLVVRELVPDTRVYRDRSSDAVVFSLIPQDLA